MAEAPSFEQRRKAGRALRKSFPLAAHAEWQPAPDRSDPIAVLEESNRGRLPDLIPVRYGRMLVSPFAFLRGAPAVMALDLAATPTIGVKLQIGGDAHLANFGVFATPERRLIFDVNDFDETTWDAWEYDVKRLVASLAVVARNLRIVDAEAAAVIAGSVHAYRQRMAGLAQAAPLDVWYDRIDVKKVVAIAEESGAKDLKKALHVGKVRHHTSLTALPKMTEVVGGRRRIVDDPPLITHKDPESRDGAIMIARYAETLAPDRRVLLDRYSVVDTVRKVVGVGSVGTRCYLILMMDADGRSPLFLQVKEARAPVWGDGTTTYSNHGERVVMGQRLMQAASDMFLGWTGIFDRDFYVRQFRDMKGSVDLDVMTTTGLASYGAVCGQALARAHARTGDAGVISGYLGGSDRFDHALVAFAESYADQTERDYEALIAAVESGRITVTTGG
jgi:uncharacterized protein (DUF2252 family)